VASKERTNGALPTFSYVNWNEVN